MAGVRGSWGGLAETSAVWWTISYVGTTWYVSLRILQIARPVLMLISTCEAGKVVVGTWTRHNTFNAEKGLMLCPPYQDKDFAIYWKTMRVTLGYMSYLTQKKVSSVWPTSSTSQKPLTNRQHNLNRTTTHHETHAK